MRLVVGIIWTNLIFGSAFAQSMPTDIFEPIQGLYVENPGQGITGPTTSAANWRVQFYGAPPGTTLNGFSQQIWGGYETDSGGTTPVAQANYNPTSTRVHLYQNGITLPCTIGGALDEYDLQLSPDEILQPNPLSTLSHMYMQANVRAIGYAESDATCSVNTSDIIDAITLKNYAANQILFYQVKLGSFNPEGMANPAKPDNGWFYKGTNSSPGSSIAQQFGYDGSAADYGQSVLRTNVAETINFDILPQLVKIIAQGNQFGMDTNLADWVVVENYPQVSVWGHVAISGYFQNVAILEQ